MGVEKMFAGISQDDEKRLTDALRTMKEVLNNMELDNE